MAGDEALVTALNDSLTAPGVEGIEEIMGMTMAEMLHAHAIAMTVAGSEDRTDRQCHAAFPDLRLPHGDRDLHQPPTRRGAIPGHRTLTGDDDLSSVPAAVLGEEQRFNGRVTSNGIRVLDFEAMEAGARAVFRVTAGPEVSVIVARIVKPPGF